MRIVALGALAIASSHSVGAATLAREQDANVALALNYAIELTARPLEFDTHLFVRLFKVTVPGNECYETLDSCPEVTVFVAVTDGDLAAEFAAYRLPLTKGWAFDGPTKECEVGAKEPVAGLRFTTAAPAHYARADWKPESFLVCVSPNSATINRAQSNQPLHPTPTAAEAPASGAGERRR